MSTEFRQLLREELWRSIAWAALGLAGWAFVITESPQLDATVWTVLGFPFLTWAFLTAGMISFRLLTGSVLQVRTTDGLHLAFLLGVIGGGFVVIYRIARRMPRGLTPRHFTAVSTTVFFYYSR